MSVGCEPGPSIGARTRTRAEVNVRPRRFGKQAGKEKENENDEETNEQRKQNVNELKS